MLGFVICKKQSDQAAESSEPCFQPENSRVAERVVKESSPERPAHVSEAEAQLEGHQVRSARLVVSQGHDACGCESQSIAEPLTEARKHAQTDEGPVLGNLFCKTEECHRTYHREKTDLESAQSAETSDHTLSHEWAYCHTQTKCAE